MNIKDYLDSTYLKTAEQAGISEKETWEKVKELTQEAMQHSFYAVMIRPKWVKKVREILNKNNSSVVLGTVISFHTGSLDTQTKLAEAQQAIEDGADELDFVINYNAFKGGSKHQVADEVKVCNELVLEAGKVIKWIIEAAALNDTQIAEITQLIKSVTQKEFPGQEDRVFVKSSTGFFQTQDDSPNGATVHNIKIMIENAGNLPVKAAGGVRNYQDALEMVALGVKRIGTSSALAISQGGEASGDY